jgi:hypothetical protein
LLIDAARYPRHAQFYLLTRLPLVVLALASLCEGARPQGEDDETLAAEPVFQTDSTAIATPRHYRNASAHIHNYIHAAAMTARGAVLATKSRRSQKSSSANKVGHRYSMQTNHMSIHHRPYAQGDHQSSQPIDALEFVMNDEDLVDTINDESVTRKELLMALGGGTGAGIGTTGNLELDLDLVRRMRYQDKGVLYLLCAMYFIVLAFSASFAYRQALNSSSVSFYADPRYHDMVMEGSDQEDFLATFAQPPKDVQLHIIGFVPVPAGALGSLEWHGEYFYDAFSFSLDLSPWVQLAASRPACESSAAEDGLALSEGIVSTDLGHLDDFITKDCNDLALVQVRKDVAWPDWEELATNIKLQIRQCGFNGIVSIHRSDCHHVTVYKNAPWANFTHSRVTKILCALSIIGWIAYLPYMWLRCTSTVVRARYTVDISIKDYWNLIADKLSADGFVEDSSVPRRTFNMGRILDTADEDLDIDVVGWQGGF